MLLCFPLWHQEHSVFSGLQHPTPPRLAARKPQLRKPGPARRCPVGWGGSLPVDYSPVTCKPWDCALCPSGFAGSAQTTPGLQTETHRALGLGAGVSRPVPTPASQRLLLLPAPRSLPHSALSNTPAREQSVSPQPAAARGAARAPASPNLRPQRVF